MCIRDSLRSGHTPDIAQTFHKVSIVEMHHLEIFGKLACMLGEDPRMWTQHGCKKAYWTPGDVYKRQVTVSPAFTITPVTSPDALAYT